MLVLSRKLDQEILIGDNIKVTVLKVKGNTVRLGIAAPREVRVVRGELPPKPESVEVELEFDAFDEEDLAKLQRESAAMSATDTVPSNNEAHLDEAMAEVTIVFDNTMPNMSKRENVKAEVDATSALLPFSRAAATESKTRRIAPQNQRTSGQSGSISFRERLPAAFKQTRLQEIVSQLTKK